MIVFARFLDEGWPGLFGDEVTPRQDIFFPIKDGIIVIVSFALLEAIRHSEDTNCPLLSLALLDYVTCRGYTRVVRHSDSTNDQRIFMLDILSGQIFERLDQVILFFLGGGGKDTRKIIK